MAALMHMAALRATGTFGPAGTQVDAQRWFSDAGLWSTHSSAPVPSRISMHIAPHKGASSAAENRCRPGVLPRSNHLGKRRAAGAGLINQMKTALFT